MSVAQRSLLIKSLSPDLIAKVIRSFDRATLYIISICWTTTLLIMILTIYTIHLSVVAKAEADKALVAEPVLPQIVRGSVNGKELQLMIERMQRRYPDVTISWGKDILTIGAADGSRYHEWLMAIGQADTLYPQYHWNIQSMCIGSKCSGNLMSISLMGERVTFQMPQTP